MAVPDTGTAAGSAAPAAATPAAGAGRDKKPILQAKAKKAPGKGRPAQETEDKKDKKDKKGTKGTKKDGTSKK